MKPRPQKPANINDHLKANLWATASTVPMMTCRKHQLPSHNAWNAWCTSHCCLLLEATALAHLKHGWLDWPAHLMRLEQFPFDLRLPLLCQFTPFLRFHPWPPAATFTSPHILHFHHSHNSSKIKSESEAECWKRSYYTSEPWITVNVSLQLYTAHTASLPLSHASNIQT